MKGKRIAILGLTTALAVSLLAVPAGAVSFEDMQGHWAREDVEYLAGLGVINGTSQTAFSPARQMTACEALLFCSRTTGVSAADRQRIAADWAEPLRLILPAEVYDWAKDEMAVCLETGIISRQELEAMCTSGALLRSITRENLSMYLVRAMQLDAMAENLTSYSMSFADTAAIAEVLKPYVYLLSSYGVVRGNSANQFMPRSNLTRAEMATMLRRTIDFMDERGIYAELPSYTSYPWTGGVIAALSAGSDGSITVTVTSELSGQTELTLPAGTAVYENNIRTTLSALRTGQYLRVNLDEAGATQSARLSGGLTAMSGAVSAVDRAGISLLADGASRRLVIDRFTRVEADGQVGGPELIADGGNYTQAWCWVDGMGHLAELKLVGTEAPAVDGSVRGVLQSVSYGGSVALEVETDQGERRSFRLDSAVPPYIRRDGASAALGQLQAGDQVALRVRNGQVYEIQAFSDRETTRLSGMLVVVDERTGTMAVQLENGQVCPVDVSGAGIMTGAGGELTLSELRPGDAIQLYGRYGEGGQFFATLIVRP
nr:S-layer homology domain-containing protein [uncultured Flavonifractor sp.]